MGKTTATNILRQRGLAVAASDEMARKLVEPGQPALTEIQAAFGQEVIDKDGRLDRQKLAYRIFADTGARQQLEAILHPRIRREWQARVQEWRAQGRTAAVNDIPLLFETKGEANFEVTICVACSAATQRSRLRRRGWTEQEIDQRIQAQWPIEQKITKAQYMVWTESSLAVHQEQLERILAMEGVH